MAKQPDTDVIYRRAWKGEAEFESWRSMIDRCERPGNPSYEWYGGRGISVCERWLGRGGYVRFLEDMGRKPSKDHSIDRIDSDGDYTPENCRWASATEQHNNKRSNRPVTYNGRTMTVSNWAKEVGISKVTLVKRLNSGWSVEHALTEPAASHPPITWSEADVREIRRRVKAKHSIRAIARSYRVTHGTIKRVIVSDERRC